MKALGQCSISVLILLLGSSAAEYVTENDKGVTLACPSKEDKSSWKYVNKEETTLTEHKKTHELPFRKGVTEGLLYCEFNEIKHYFYINVKACKNCINLDTGTVIGIICGDILLTLLVVMGVYSFAKKRGGNSKEFRHPQFEPMETPAGRSANVTASHQQSHYAPIKSGQRDVYDKLQR